MIETLVVLVLALVTIAASTLLGPRFGIAAPLVLVVVGVAASFIPLFSSVHIESEWILEGILPPLLYSAAVSMPAMNFRREFGAIGGLSVVLVVATSLLLGVFFMLVIPGLGFAWGVALGAIVSPTDAVATSIIKKTRVSPRVVAMLDGESLLNDATALVLLRTAIVAAAATFSFWGTVGSFAYSVLIALLIGGVVGFGNLAIRRRVTDSTVNTLISFTVPFLASVPAELLGASGLVAAVVAGLVTGIRAPRVLSPQNRLSDAQNWRMVELVLEGAVFLTMGVQLKGIVEAVERDHAGAGVAVGIAVGALMLTILIRAAYVAPLLAVLRAGARRSRVLEERLQDMQQRMATPEGKSQTLAELNDPEARAKARGRAWRGGRAGRAETAVDAGAVAASDSAGADAAASAATEAAREETTAPGGAVTADAHPELAGSVSPGRGRVRTERDIERFATRVRRSLADIEYFRQRPLGWREGVIVVWAGMRGAVTVAAAQSLAEDTPQRSVLVLIAFTVAGLSLLLQGGTVAALVRRITPVADPAETEAQESAEWRRLMELMRTASEGIPAPASPLEAGADAARFAEEREYRLAVIRAQRSALLDARDDGTFDAAVLENALANLDAAQIAMELRGRRSSSAD